MVPAKLRMMRLIRGFGIALIHFAALAGLLLTARPAFAFESRSYAVSWFAPAVNSTEGDCPDGMNIPWAQQELKNLAALGYSQKQIDDLLKLDANRDRLGSGIINVIMEHRGRLDGHPVNPVIYPATVPDPQLRYLKGKYAYGFNLDGRGSASLNSFEDPETHELGVNNQLYRALGCIRVFRGTLAIPSTYWSYLFEQVKYSQPSWLITIEGEDLSKDGNVTVIFDRALEHMRYNLNGTPRSNVTYRIDPDPRSHNVFRGHLKDGIVILAEPGSARISMRDDWLLMNDFRMDKVHMRLKMKGDGTLRCMMGGYQPWADLFWAFSAPGEATESQVTGDLVGIYYLFRKLADADPDPNTGNNAEISATYYIEAVPAFAVPVPTAEKPAAKVLVLGRTR